MRERENRSTARLAWAAIFAIVATLALGTSTAFGQSDLSNPSAAQYNPQSQVQATTTTGSAATSDRGGGGGGGALPFTGEDVIVVAAVAAAMVGTGVALRRLSTVHRHEP